MTLASKVSPSLFARIRMYAPDIQTSLHTSDVLLGMVMHSLSF
ncbi:hypothetical protein Q2941_01420 [Bradyrhizobium sp. UFLA05-153]